MRRSGSASCILRPKNSLSAEDLQRLATEAPKTTVLTVNRLPSYCTDRLYMLSELQVHANSIRFLSDVARNSRSSTIGDVGDADVKDTPSPQSAPAFPPSIILYLLWKNNTYPTPRSFADGPLSECVRQCLLANGEGDPQDELEVVRSSPRSSPYSPRRRQSMERQLSSQSKEQLMDTFDQLSQFETKLADEGSDESSALKDGHRSKANSLTSLADARNNSDSSGENDSPGREGNSSQRNIQKDQQYKQKEQLTKIYVVVDRIPSPESEDSGIGELPNFPDLGSSSSLEEALKGNQMKYKNEYTSAGIQPVGESPQVQHTQQNQQQSKRLPQSNEQREQEQLDQHNNEIRTAEQLARAVASSRFLRNRIDGISIGITSDARAAPGLEACMDAVERGAKERRLAMRNRSIRNMKKNRKGKMGDSKEDFYKGDEKMQFFWRKEQSLGRLREMSPERSPVAIVAMQPDDLEGADHHHHHDHLHHHHAHSEHDLDSSPKILQCRVSTEWEGKGECNSFTDRAMGDWRQAWCGGDNGVSDNVNGGNATLGRCNSGRSIRPKVPRISSRGQEEMDYEEYDVDEPISTAMVIVFLAVAASYVWSSYGDAILSFLFGDLLEEA